MKTHPKSASVTTRLPPPPAPTARDANPWPMPEQYGAPPVVRTHPKVRSPESAESPPDLRPPVPRPTVESRDQHRSIIRMVPLLIMLAAAIAAVIAARDAIAAGDIAGALGPVLVAGVIAFSGWRRWSRK